MKCPSDEISEMYVYSIHVHKELARYKSEISQLTHVTYKRVTGLMLLTYSVGYFLK